MRITIYPTLIIFIVSLNLIPAFAASCEANGCRDGFESDVACFVYAAERGDSHAQHALGYIFASGQGEPQDLNKAYAWWATAAMNGIETARDNIDMLRKNMTIKEREEAELSAMELFLNTRK